MSEGVSPVAQALLALGEKIPRLILTRLSTCLWEVKLKDLRHSLWKPKHILLSLS